MKDTISKYGFIRTAVCSPEMRVADITFNKSKIIEAINSASSEGVSLLLFPELCLSAYTCGDLFFQKVLIDNQIDAIIEICESTLDNEMTIVIGAALVSESRLFNTAVIISSGELKAVIPKTYLCNSNEYYEERWFSSENDRLNDFIEISGQRVPFGSDILVKDTNSPALIGVEICEDLWSVIPPSSYQAAAGANILLNLSASDEYLGKSAYRDSLVIGQSARCLAAYCYASSGPGESSTDLVYSGQCIISENGSLLNRTEKYQFVTQMGIADIDIEKLSSERLKNNSFSSSKPDKIFRIVEVSLKRTDDSKLRRKISPTPFVPSNENERAEVCREIFSLQSTALAKRIKHLNIKDLVIGISGGLDSTLALLVSVKAFEKLGLPLKGIHSLRMPGFGTSIRTKNNALKLAELLGTDSIEISISDAVNQHFKDIGHDINKLDIVFENSQARERTQILMDFANKVSGIVVGTGDLSELALGWATYNGDHISMYGVNAGVPKTLVRYLIEWCSDELFSGEISSVLKDISNTPISPELLPTDKEGNIAQKTEENIGPYLLNDFFLYYFLRFGFSPKKILFIANQAFEDQFTKKEIKLRLETFIQRFFSQQFKRSCLPDGVKVGTVSLSPRGDWRMPSDACPSIWEENHGKMQ